MTFNYITPKLKSHGPPYFTSIISWFCYICGPNLIEWILKLTKYSTIVFRTFFGPPCRYPSSIDNIGSEGNKCVLYDAVELTFSPNFIVSIMAYFHRYLKYKSSTRHLLNIGKSHTRISYKSLIFRVFEIIIRVQSILSSVLFLRTKSLQESEFLGFLAWKSLLLRIHAIFPCRLGTAKHMFFLPLWYTYAKSK